MFSKKFETYHGLGTRRKTLRVGVAHYCLDGVDIDISLDSSDLSSKQFARYSRDLSLCWSDMNLVIENVVLFA
jgi:hypothetical protein